MHDVIDEILNGELQLSTTYAVLSASNVQASKACGTQS
jgi:hypothetical protein